MPNNDDELKKVLGQLQRDERMDAVDRGEVSPAQAVRGNRAVAGPDRDLINSQLRHLESIDGQLRSINGKLTFFVILAIIGIVTQLILVFVR